MLEVMSGRSWGNRLLHFGDIAKNNFQSLFTFDDKGIRSRVQSVDSIHTDRLWEFQDTLQKHHSNPETLHHLETDAIDAFIELERTCQLFDRKIPDNSVRSCKQWITCIADGTALQNQKTEDEEYPGDYLYALFMTSSNPKIRMQAFDELARCYLPQVASILARYADLLEGHTHFSEEKRSRIDKAEVLDPRNLEVLSTSTECAFIAQQKAFYTDLIDPAQPDYGDITDLAWRINEYIEHIPNNRTRIDQTGHRLKKLIDPWNIIRASYGRIEWHYRNYYQNHPEQFNEISYIIWPDTGFESVSSSPSDCAS